MILKHFLQTQREDEAIPLRRRCLHAWKIIIAEMFKQHRALFNKKLTYFSMLIWPLLELAIAYYTLRPFFDLTSVQRHWTVAENAPTILLFFVTGTLGYSFFGSTLQSAWMFSWERYHGTMELLFLSPANRLVLILANGIGALLQNVWLFLVFTIGIIIFNSGFSGAHLVMFPFAFFALLISSISWAVFLNSFCIFVRDAGFAMNLLEAIMPFLTGVRMPLTVLPTWLYGISLLFPLTTSLILVRGSLLNGDTLATLWPYTLLLLLISICLFVLAAWLLKIGENHARQHGTLTLF
jgi:ABC-2 type transport system permease protein